MGELGLGFEGREVAGPDPQRLAEVPAVTLGIRPEIGPRAGGERVAPGVVGGRCFDELNGRGSAEILRSMAVAAEVIRRRAQAVGPLDGVDGVTDG